MKKTVLAAVMLAFLTISLGATRRNVAPDAKATVSDQLTENLGAACLNDGIIMHDGDGEWACKGSVTSWGEMHLPWAKLEWTSAVTIDKVVLYDRVSCNEHLSGGTLSFDDGTRISVTEIPNDGSPKEICFPAKNVKWLKFEATDGAGKNLGLSEIQAFAVLDSDSRYVEWADPYIETTRGRWFYCTPGGRPMGMIAAHAFTRDKNQGGGGYNYNFNEILGFSQINDWMMSGPNLMPVSGDVNPMLGMNGWKSSFKHGCETIQPGYHKIFLEKYSTWVEYTATERVAFYRMDYCGSDRPGMIVDAGSMLGNCTMKDAFIYKVSDNRIEGQFSTTDRFWGGPNDVKLFFVLESDKPFKSTTGWSEKGVMTEPEYVMGNGAGMLLQFDTNDMAEVKIALSYTSIENASANMASELPGWDFDAVREETQSIWDEQLGRIDVEGGTYQQKIKFYTDLWHVLLGRHKINDVNGAYPDYTGGEYVDHRTSTPLVVRQLPMGNGAAKHNMYGFDALWLTQWNLNVLWGIAWPEILDDFSACLVEYAKNGKLLPRGACAGGYSFIMTGSPSSSMIVSTYMQGLLTKVSAEEAFQAVKSNHLPGGMMSYESADELKFYIRNGYCPESAGKTLQWSFEDWGLSQMAAKLGKKSDAKEFDRRSHGWKKLYDPSTGFVFPKKADGSWLHQDPLSGQGWVEANAWQATWSASHDLKDLVKMEGGSDAFCSKLNEAFEKAVPDHFVNEYFAGYVSYANQPGCSDAHLFSYAGKPWLTQYWVRQVKEKAYGGTAPDLGYGGHDEDAGQMGGVSVLMSIGLFSVTGCESQIPYYDITSPIFDKITIRLNRKYCSGDKFVIDVEGNSADNCYIQSAELNGQPWNSCQFPRSALTSGGEMRIVLGKEPQTGWGTLQY